jgi:hypothetical protein
MQEQPIKSPDRYDWSGFTRQERGFLKAWCRQHEFSFQTAYQLIHGLYVGGSGPRISAIIRAALADGLIKPIDDLDEAA